VNLASIPHGSTILRAGAYTLDAWGANAPADSVCIGTKTDIDLIVNEASCAAAGWDNTVLDAAVIYGLTDGQAFGLIRGYKRITSDATPRSSNAKTWFVIEWVEGVSEP